jgi:4a-hydroxytetrahydrobiopterin dehydratase
MTDRTRLDEAALADALRTLEGWQVKNDRLTRTYRFRDFLEAFGFMASAAMVMQQLDHHAEWSNVYNTVTLALTTHDAGGITARDVDLACRLHALAGRRMASAV